MFNLLPDDAVKGARCHLLLRSLCEDLRGSAHAVIVNRVAGSAVMPRAGRYLLYRAAGIATRTANIFPGCIIAGTDLSIGPETFINCRCFLEAIGPLTIGARCQIAMEAMLLTSTHPILADGSVAHHTEKASTSVGDDCWIGARAIVVPGVTIGKGCIIGAGAVVTKNCEPRGIYGGVPARRLRDLRETHLVDGSAAIRVLGAARINEASAR